MRIPATLYGLGVIVGVSGLWPTKYHNDAADISAADVLRKLKAQGVGVEGLADQVPGTRCCAAACDTLLRAYGADLLLLHTTSVEYRAFTASYWSQQQSELQPYCVYKPRSALEVSTAVLISRHTQCPFVVKSGGHAAFANASSTSGGIAISLENLKKVSVSVGSGTVRVEPGNTWGPLYQQLEAQNLSVVGGRVYGIGTGGLTLGGGISFFANTLGWACDNVASYEIVLANGNVVLVTPKRHSDLYKALRGGGNNFGIVTAFELYSFPLAHQIWGGTRYVNNSDSERLSRAFAKVNADAPTDIKAGTWLANIQAGDLRLSSVERWYTQPDGDRATIWKPYTDIVALSDDAKQTNVSGYAAKLASFQPSGSRNIYYAITVKNDPDLTVLSTEVFFRNISRVSGIPGIVLSQVYQTISTPALRQMRKRGGNVLNLSTDDGPYQVIGLSASWKTKSDDVKVYQFMSEVLYTIKAVARAKGLHKDYVYMNYASQFQDVIGSYGREQKEYLQATASKYDPSGIFQNLQPGYFKLERAPDVESGLFSF